MGMLTIVNRVAVTQLTRGEQVGIPASPYRRWLETDHGAQADARLAHFPAPHHHQPVDAAGLTRPTMLVRILVQVLEECVAVPHQLPRTSTAMQRIHVGRCREPRRARALVCRKETRCRRCVLVLMLFRRRRLWPGLCLINISAPT